MKKKNIVPGARAPVAVVDVVVTAVIVVQPVVIVIVDDVDVDIEVGGKVNVSQQKCSPFFFCTHVFTL